MSSSSENLKVIRAADGFDSPSLNLEAGELLRILPGRREVFKASLVDSQTDVVVKSFLPHAKQARDWENEWNGLLALQTLDLPTPKPLAVCQSEAGTVGVVMEYIADAVTLGVFLEDSAVGQCQAILEKLSRLVDVLHRSGARQSDQHVDNWAVSGGEIFLLDAGTFHFNKGALNEADRLTDLAAICATLPSESEQAFREFLDALYWTDGGEQRSQVLGAKLEAAIVELQQERARRYFKKTQRTCTEFEVKTSSGFSGMYSRQADAELIERFFSDPDAMMAEGARLKSGNTCTVQRIEFNEQSYVLKRYNVKPWLTQVRRSMASSRARLSWANGWVLDLAFVPTATPVAFADEGSFPRGRSYLLMKEIEGELLPDYVAKHSSDAERVSSLVAEVGRIWDSLGRLRAAHGDLKATNWMVNTEGKVSLFDLDSFRFGLSEAAFQRGRQKDLSRFLKNWSTEPDLLEAFWSRMEGGKGT